MEEQRDEAPSVPAKPTLEPPVIEVMRAEDLLEVTGVGWNQSTSGPPPPP